MNIASLSNLINSSGILSIFLQKEVVILVGMALLLMALSTFQRPSKSEKTRARFANRSDEFRVARNAAAQLKSFSIKDVPLYLGSFENWQLNPLWLWFSIHILNSPPCIFVPSANPGVEVVGAPSVGKTFSVIDRLLTSAIEQEFPIALYDFKAGKEGGIGGQTEYIGALAARHGYKLRIFAPGQPHTCIINPLDFIEDPNDVSMAESLAKTLVLNLRENKNASTDAFFENAGLRLLYSAFLLAKATKYPDLVTAYSFLELPDLGERLDYAFELLRSGKAKYFNVWHKVALSQFREAYKSAETGAGILANAQDIAALFVRPEMVACLIGKTNVSLDLTEKEILIFQSDEQKQRVYNPLIAVNIDLLVHRNFNHQRKAPFVLSLDEFSTIRINDAINWPNLHRSKGLIQIVGYQCKAQQKASYGVDSADILKVGTKTRFWFNPQHQDTAREWSAFLGKREILEESKTYSKKPNGWGQSVSVTKRKTLAPLMNEDDFNTMAQGGCIYINMHSESNSRAFIAKKFEKIKIPKKEIRFISKTKNLWPEILSKLIDKESRLRIDNSQVQRELILRAECVDAFLPAPPKPKKKGEKQSIRKEDTQLFVTNK